MSVIRAAWQTFLWAKPAQSLAARSIRHRWPASFIVGASSAGALWFLWAAISAHYHRGPLSVAAKRADLVISVSGDGVVESADNLDVQNRVPGRRNILEIVPDGSYLRQGDLIVRLDSAAIEETIAAERAALSAAEAEAIRAKKSWEVARIAVDEYREGIYVRQRHELSRHILDAQQRLASVEHSLLQTQIMFRKSFISYPHVLAMQSAVEKERSDLAAVKHKRDVLDRLTRVKVTAELAGKRDAAAARWASAVAVVRTKATKIARLVDEVKYCAMRAPRDGMVVYCGSMGATNQPQSQAEQRAVYPGATVRQSQTLVRLADLGKLQVKLLLPRSKLGELRRGQRAHIRVLDQELRGGVVSIADRPEAVASPGHNFTQYAVAIALEGRGERLKPGMNAEVELLVTHKENALVIPALCVAGERDRPSVRVKKPGGAARREVKLGIANDVMVEVLEGLNEGELVLLNPEG